MYLLELRSRDKGQIDLRSAFKYHIGGNMVIVCRYIDGIKEPHIGVTGSGALDGWKWGGCTSKGSRNRGNIKYVRGLCGGEAVGLGSVEMGGRDVTQAETDLLSFFINLELI